MFFVKGSVYNLHSKVSALYLVCNCKKQGIVQIVVFEGKLSKNQRNLLKKIPDFDVLSEDNEKTAMIVMERLNENGFKNVKIVNHEPIGEIIPERTEIRVGKDTLAFIYKPIACHSYNTINIAEKDINVATIDTMLSFYLAFIYADKPFPYFNKDRIICMAKFLFDVEEENRLEQKGLLKRFTTSCYGNQTTLETIRAEKAEKFKELRDKRGTRDYEMWFLKYVPANMVKNVKEKECTKMNGKTKFFINL